MCGGSGQRDARCVQALECAGADRAEQLGAGHALQLLHALLDGLLMQKIVDSAAIDEEFVVQTLETLALALFAIDPAALPPAPKA